MGRPIEFSDAMIPITPSVRPMLLKGSVQNPSQTQGKKTADKLSLVGR